MEGLEQTYEYPPKNAIRDHWVPFASAGVPKAALEQIAVWFLPGHECLEVPHYRRAGVPMRRLLGFEWDTERAAKIRKEAPRMALVEGSLKTFLQNPHIMPYARPDWANLDFDGPALAFGEEIRETIRRMRLLRAPRLGLSSLGERDRNQLIEAVKIFSFWAGVLPERFNSGIDLLRQDNERQGLVLREPQATRMLCRELAAVYLLLRGFGERSYGEGDKAEAEDFGRFLSEAEAALDKEIRERLADWGDKPMPIPVVPVRGLEERVLARRIPVVLGDRLRFAYRSLLNRWRWTWYWSFKESEPKSLRDWAEELLLVHPPLHVVDFTGAVIGNRKEGVCRFCERKEQINVIAK